MGKLKGLALAALLALGGAGIALAAESEDAGQAPLLDVNGVLHGKGYLGTRSKLGVLYWAPKRIGAPASYDLREQGLLTPIRDQKSCGSCYSFAITKAFESALLKAGRGSFDLSEQEIVSCAPDAYKCNGGFMDTADYITKRGLSLEKDYPYTATSSRCKSPLPPVAAKAVRWGYVGSSSRGPTLEEIKQALQDYGALFTTVAAGGTDWSRGGDMTNCRSTSRNHMVGLGGWRTDDKLIVVNSWGTAWGDKGYGYAKQGCNNIATGTESVGFVFVDGGPAPTPPHIRLPAQIDILPGTESVPVGVKSEPGVTYAWYDDTGKLPQTESVIFVTVNQDTVFRLVATTNAGTAESSVKVHVLPEEY